MKLKQSRYPNTRLGWHKYYVARFNKTQHPDAEYQAMVYLLLHLAFEGTP